MLIIKLALFFVLFHLFITFLLFLVSFYTSRKIKKKCPLLYVIGYRNGVAILGNKSDSWVDAVGYIPMCKAKVKSGTVRSCGWVSYELKPRFTFLDPIPYNVKIVQYVQ